MYVVYIISLHEALLKKGQYFFFLIFIFVVVCSHLFWAVRILIPSLIITLTQSGSQLPISILGSILWFHTTVFTVQFYCMMFPLCGAFSPYWSSRHTNELLVQLENFYTYFGESKYLNFHSIALIKISFSSLSIIK